MPDFFVRTLYVAWRSKPGEPRFVIAKISRNASAGLRFGYLPEYEKAQQAGLSHLFGFKDADNLHASEIENLVKMRLVGKDRPDRAEFMRFWEAGDITDPLDQLAFTQGMSPTDNFEFLADYNTARLNGHPFVTDLAGLTHAQLPPHSLREGDVLTYRHVPHKKDEHAVAVYQGHVLVGYIKRVHNLIFERHQRRFSLTVKAVEKNGVVKKVFLKVV